MFEQVKKSLKTEFGPDGHTWWTEGVPQSVRTQCTNRWELKKREGESWNYLNLIDYEDIAKKNWTVVKNYFAFDAPNKDNKTACLEWIKPLNDIRNKTVHPEKGRITDDEIKLVKEMHDKVMQYFPDLNDDTLNTKGN